MLLCSRAADPCIIRNNKLVLIVSIICSCFQGDIEEAHIIPGPYGYLKQCPHAEQSCPTCAQFSLLQDAVVSLQNNLIDLKQRVNVVEYSHIFDDIVLIKLFSSASGCRGASEAT